MSINLLVAPDFSPEHYSGWHLLNTVLQRRTGLAMRLWMPASSSEQAQLIAEGKADLVYANPFDASALIRDAGYLAVARPRDSSNEIVMATGAESPLDQVENLPAGLRVALTDNRDVKLISLRLLEIADLGSEDIVWQVVESHQAAARQVIRGEADACFLLASLYHSLSRLTLAQLKPLVESRLGDVTHVLLASPALGDSVEALQSAITELSASPDGQRVLDELGIPKGFDRMTQDEGEFMVDLMETLRD